MKRFKDLGDTPISSPLPAEDVLELHAARLVLLLKHCGVKNRIDGLTKLAKLDFFVRYPEFFGRAVRGLGSDVESTPSGSDSAMIRYRYGPWDDRYYHLLSYLESVGLISIESAGKLYRIALSSDGIRIATQVGENACYFELVQHMKEVKARMGKRGGTTLKNMIYEMFDREVGSRPIGEVIE